MGTKTKSEELFETFCNSNDILFNKIPTASYQGLQTPDYEIILFSNHVIVEVKQFDPNTEDLVLIENYHTKGRTGIYGNEPGKRVRNKITDAMPQLRILAKYKYPAILVLYDNIQTGIRHADSYNVKTGMYGLECVDIAFPTDMNSEPSIIDQRRGGKRKVTDQHNTTLSGVMVIRVNEKNGISAICYHNIFAALPLNPDWMRYNNVVHYTLEEKQGPNFQEWVKI